MALTVLDGTDTTQVMASGDHDEVTGLELDEVDDLAGLDVHTHGVVHLDVGVGVADGPSVVGNDKRGTLLSELVPLHLAELVLGLIIGDAVEDEAALDVKKKSEPLVGLLDGDDIHETSGEGLVSADLAVNLDEALHEDGVHLSAVEGVLKAVPQKKDEGKGLPELVGTSRGAGGEDAAHFVKHPVLGGIKPLHVLLGSTGHGEYALPSNKR
mmetsp:Transcript_32294/g.83819  ORF Transcript_32294/g.83819 Transcript_32294/m.83819 type:complete len:212 (-) Transcript_32294:7-642(-)